MSQTQIGYAATGLEITNHAVTATVTTVTIAAGNRQVVHLRNIGTDTVWIGTATNPPVAATSVGYPLGAATVATGLGEGFTIQNPCTSVELKVVCAAGLTSRLAVIM